MLAGDPRPSESNVGRWMALLESVARELSRELGAVVVVDPSIAMLAVSVWRRRGLPYCPCRPLTTDPRYVCPCIEIEDAELLLRKGRCTCGLFRVVKA